MICDCRFLRPNGPELSGALRHLVKHDCGGEQLVPCSSLRGRIC